MNRTTFGWIMLLSLLAAAGCARQQQPVPVAVEKDVITEAVAVLHPTEGNTVHGVVRFTKHGQAITVVADVEGLTEGKHGFHIHQYGDCEAADASSAGGHFNPFKKPHAGPSTPDRHVGDMGNLVADATGKAHLEMDDSLLAFYGPASIIGRAVIVHGGEDDLMSQPSGNAGPRVACGVIGIKKEQY